jgi:hypothetical protein
MCKVIRRIVLIVIICILISCGLIFLHTTWKYPHGWIFNVVYYDEGKPEILDTYIVIDTNVKMAILRAEKYVEKEYPSGSQAEIIWDIGRMPWAKSGIRGEKIESHIEKLDEDAKYQINPTIDDSSSTGVYIPADLDGCFKELDKMLNPQLIREMKSGTEEDMYVCHFGLGKWMRNHWGLWSDSVLAEYFNTIGISHPDDMSGIILTSYYRYLHNEPINLNEQVQYYKNYWEKVSND